MYTVVTLKLPPDVTMEVGDGNSRRGFFDTRSELSVASRSLKLSVPETGGRTISVINYLVGERIVFRKSLSGLKIIRGLPDYTGLVKRVDLTESLAERVEGLRAQFVIDSGLLKENLRYSNNLCNEIFISGDYDGYTGASGPSRSTGSYYAELMRTRPQIGGLSQREASTLQSRADEREYTRRALEASSRMTGELRDYQMTMHSSLAQLSRTELGRTANQTELSRRYRNAWDSLNEDFRSALSGSDFDGDTRVYVRMAEEENRRFLDQMQVAYSSTVQPRYVDNRHEVQPVSLIDARQATTEVVRGERGRPPASRGPRPRNQRW